MFCGVDRVKVCISVLMCPLCSCCRYLGSAREIYISWRRVYSRTHRTRGSRWFDRTSRTTGRYRSSSHRSATPVSTNARSTLSPRCRWLSVSMSLVSSSKLAALSRQCACWEIYENRLNWKLLQSMEISSFISLRSVTWNGFRTSLCAVE